MSADNWTICPNCQKIIKEIREKFIKKYYGKLNAEKYNQILEEINKAIEYINSYSEEEYEPDKEVIKLMEKEQIQIERKGIKYNPEEMLFQGKTSCCLREDYEIGTDKEGYTYFDYECSCSNCGFSKSIYFDEIKHKIITKD